jgi:hypothetical protein
MPALRRRTPSLSWVLGALALFVAMSGTAVAATQIDGSRLKDRSVPHDKLVRNAITGAEVAEGTLGKVPMAKLADKATALPRPAMHAFAFNTNWGPTAVYTTRQTGFTKDLEGYVHLQGLAARSSGSDALIATLPAGFRPKDWSYFPVATFSGPGTVFISGSGELRLGSGSASFVSLEGVVFRADK